MAKIKWKVQYRVKRGAPWKNRPEVFKSRALARFVGAAFRVGGFVCDARGSTVQCWDTGMDHGYGFGNTRVVAVRGKK